MTWADGSARSSTASGLPPAWMVHGLILAACLGGSLASRALALPPASISALDPSAGIGLACVLVWGWRALPAIGLAQLLFQFTAGSPWHGGSVGVPLLMTLGAMAQCLLGARLVQRVLGPAPVLSEPRDIGAFMLLGGFVAGSIGSATAAATWISTLGLRSEGLAFDVATWWISQALSVCAVAPIVLSLIGRPRAEWTARRSSVALPLVCGLLLLAAMIAGVLRTDEQRVRSSFERESMAASSLLTLELLEPLRALEAMRSVFTAAESVDRDGVRLAALPWLEGPGHLQSLGFNTRVALEDIPAFEARVRGDGLAGFRVFDRNEANTERSPPVAEVYAITYMEPASRGVSRLGLNSLSIQAAREAIRATVRSGLPAATRLFRLTQDPTGPQQMGTVTYQAVYRGQPKTEAERLAAARGVVLTTIRLDETLKAVLDRLPKSIAVCIVDVSPDEPRQRLAGAAGCEHQSLRLSHVQPVPFAGRRWELRINAHAVDLPGTTGGNAWSVSIAGMLASALLAMLLLTVTGRTRRIEAAVDEARRAREAADAANAAKGDFLANMSHEIRTPMNAILGMAHLALRSGLNPRQHDYVSKIERSARALLGVIDDILDFSKVDAGKLQLETAPFQFGDVMETLASLIGLKAEDKGLELIFAEPPELGQALVGDALRLTQVLVNLGGNAVKFTERGEIVIAIEARHRDAESISLRFSVRDTGVGIEAGQRERLFRAFEQADSSTSRRFGGTGLGLAISSRLVRLMGGALDVHSTPGAGSEFFFELRFGLQPAAANEPASPRPSLEGQRLLVVDDNATARHILAAMATAFGLEVDEARDGWDALRAASLAAAAGRAYDIVLIDWKMPGMDGVACARQLASAPAGRPPAILMTTGFGREELIQRLGAEPFAVGDVLAKPVLPSSLFDACAGALGRPVPRPAARSVSRGESPLDPRSSLLGARILLVEDNDINAELALELLGDAGLQVERARDGGQALALLAEAAFDGVLMDCQMPVLDGYEATRAIRRQARWQDLPVIAMTANALYGDREKALAAGMNDHIAKPIDVEAMFDTLARWVRPAMAPAGAARAPVAEADDAHALVRLPGIDARIGRASTRGNDMLYRRLLLKFRDSQAGFVERFRAALRAGDEAGARRLVHDLRAVSGTLGALSIEQTARLLEAACSGGATPQSVEPLLAAVSEELDRVIEGLRPIDRAP